MRALPAELSNQCGVFTAAQALAAGWSQDSLDRAVIAGRLRRLHRGALALPLGPGLTEHEWRRKTLLQDAVAAALVVRRSALSHAAAAVAHRLPLLTVPDTPCLRVPAGAQCHRPGIHLHRRAIPVPVCRLGNVGVTTVAQTCLDVAAEHGLAAGVVAADAALQAGTMTTTQLLRVCASARPGSARRRAVELCRLANGLSESPLESLSRLAMAHFEPAPHLQARLYGLRGQLIGRVDFFWSELGVVGEADGAVKYSARNAEPLLAEKYRQDELTAHNLVVVRWGWREAHDPQSLHDKLRRGFAQASTLRSAGLLPTVRHELARPLG